MNLQGSPVVSLDSPSGMNYLIAHFGPFTVTLVKTVSGKHSEQLQSQGTTGLGVGTLEACVWWGQWGGDWAHLQIQQRQGSQPRSRDGWGPDLVMLPEQPPGVRPHWTLNREAHR